MAVAMESGQAVAEHMWRKAMLRADVSHATLRVGLEVATYGDYKTGRNVRPSMSTIAADLGYCRRHVMTQMRSLREGGWLTPSGAKGPKGVIDYVLTLPGQGVPVGSPVKPKSSHNLSNTLRSLKAPIGETARKAVSKEETRKAAGKAAHEEIVKSYGDLASPDYDWNRWVESSPNESTESPF